MNYAIHYMLGILFIAWIFVFPRWLFETTATSIMKQFDRGNYSVTIRKAKRLYRFVKMESSILVNNEKYRRRADFCLIFLAISFFERKEYENFQKNLRQIQEDLTSKWFWFALSDLIVSKDPISAKEHYKDYLALFPSYSPHYSTLIDALILYEEGKTEEARSKLEEAERHIHLPVLKRIATEYLLKYSSSKA